MRVSVSLGFSVILFVALFLPMTLFPQQSQRDSLLSDIATGKTRIVDLSYAINDKLVPWPGDARWFEAQVNATVEKNGYLHGAFGCWSTTERISMPRFISRRARRLWIKSPRNNCLDLRWSWTCARKAP